MATAVNCWNIISLSQEVLSVLPAPHFRSLYFGKALEIRWLSLCANIIVLSAGFIFRRSTNIVFNDYRQRSHLFEKAGPYKTVSCLAPKVCVLLNDRLR